MGTNYYRLPILTEEELDKKLSSLKECILSYNHVAAEDIFNDLVEEVHIGKASAGWQFLFDHNNWRYYKDKKSLEEFLDSGIIIDEYTRTYTSKQFWDIVEERRDLFNNESYSATKKFLTNDNSDFYIDDLRFCEHTNFL